MKNLKKISRENLKSISGGINVPINDMACGPGKKKIMCVDPDTGATSWQCTVNGDVRLCLRLVEV